MIIGIDISQVIYETGVSSYTDNLIRNLSEIDTKNKYKLFAGSLRRKNDFNKFLKKIKNANFEGIVYPFPPTFLNFLWNKIHVYGVEKFVGNIDLFHASDWTQPPTKAKKVTTIHDLVPILYPEWSFPKVIDAHKRRLSWVKKEVDMIISPTKSTRLDLVSLGFSKSKVKVIMEAPDEIYKPISRDKLVKTRKDYKIEGDYVLCVGVTPRKNLVKSIKAFNVLKKSINELKLVVVGHKYDNALDAEDVIYTNHVEKNELPNLYSGAECLLYPSFYEGFGLPILEAMACGTPVVTSNRSSMKEVAGSAAVLVDPDDVKEIADGVKQILKNKSKYIGRGKKRIKDFNWRSTAKSTLELYENLAGK